MSLREQVTRLAPRVLTVLFLTSAYLLLGVLAFNQTNLIVYISIFLSTLNMGLLGAVWIFVLAKHFSTHQVKVVDLKSAAAQAMAPKQIEDPLDAILPKPNLTKRRVLTPSDAKVDAFDDDMSFVEAHAEEIAQRASRELFGPTKENLKDSLL